MDTAKLFSCDIASHPAKHTGAHIRLQHDRASTPPITSVGSPQNLRGESEGEGGGLYETVSTLTEEAVNSEPRSYSGVEREYVLDAGARVYELCDARDMARCFFRSASVPGENGLTVTVT